MKVQGFSMRWWLALLVSVLLTACSDDKASTDTAEVRGPVAFEAGDECHICGMIITELPGAKAQAVDSRSSNVQKFCSTQDMLSWWLQPENKNLKAELYVHDMVKTPWEHPQDEHLIDARSAWYVVGSSVQGAMGPSLVSFSEREAAETLAATKGGRVLNWEQLDMAVLQELASAGHEHAAAYGDQLQHEHGAAEPADEHIQHSADEHPVQEAPAAPVEHDAHSQH